MKLYKQTVIDYLLNKEDLLLTKQQLDDKGLLGSPPYSYTAKIYMSLQRGNLDGVHIPHSDVYYVRAAVDLYTGYYFPLDAVEQAMKASGWRDGWKASKVSEE
jgi:hypothetical protein